MSAEQADILVGIKEKIRMVRSRLQEQEVQNQDLIKRNGELEQLVQQKQLQIEELEERNQKLVLGKGILAESADADDARIQINKIVREIDNCIALLNRT